MLLQDGVTERDIGSGFYCLLFIFLPTNVHIYIEILNYITNAPTCFGASAPSYGSFHIAFAKVIKY
jgi:hypothetical protein